MPSEEEYWFNAIIEVDENTSTDFSDNQAIVRLCLEFGFEDTIYE